MLSSFQSKLLARRATLPLIAHSQRSRYGKVFLDSLPPYRVEEVSQLLAVRISNFGAMVRNLVPGAAITRAQCLLRSCR
jgi:hypothetical protein